MKKKLAALALFAAAVFALSACSTKVTVSLNRNWNYNTTAAYDASFYEQLTYDVRYTESESGSTNGLKYTGLSGTYTVTTQAASYHRQSDGLTVAQAYKQTTVLEVSATIADKDGNAVYAFGGETGVPADKITSTVWFRDTSDGLAPLESSTEVYSHTPVNAAIGVYSYKTSVSYNESGSKAKIAVTDTSSAVTEESDKISIGAFGDSSYNLSKLTKSYSCFDNEQLLFAGRGLTFESGSSNKVTVVSATGGKQTVTLSCKEIVSSDYSFLLDGEQVSGFISACSVQFSLTGTDNTGVTHSVRYAARNENASANKYRNLPLLIESPIAYSMGTLSYVLTAATHTAPSQG